MNCYYCETPLKGGNTSDTGFTCRWCADAIAAGLPSSDEPAVRQAAKGLAAREGRAWIVAGSLFDAVTPPTFRVVRRPSQRDIIVWSIERQPDGRILATDPEPVRSTHLYQRAHVEVW
jgi:hypothetical protein